MTRKQAVKALRKLGLPKDVAERACDAARAQGEVMTSEAHVARVEYKDGEYTVTR